MNPTRTQGELGISPREAEVLCGIEDHLTNAEIAARLFISIRTVESHVSSLLRKLRATDRRALITIAPTVRAGVPAGDGSSTPAAVPARIPAQLTSFIGRVREQAALADAISANRLVTAVGPGGVGKTRLAVAVAGKSADRFADGAWFVDLVPVADPSMLAPAIVTALGLGEHRSRSAEDTVIGWLAPRESLLVLDNCEHLLDGVVVLLERLLANCPRLSVLTTSRARLLVPFEWVFPVPGLSVEADEDGPGDAVALFRVRAEAGGSAVPLDNTPRLAAICQALDGVALAIELTAARVPSLGLDGIETGLADQLRLLTGGRRVDDRHRSLRSALDWSYALLDEAGKAALRRTCVFATPFTPAAACEVAGWSSAERDALPATLAGLAEQSLLVATAEPAGTRYRALEAIRQYGADRLADAGESIETRSRHLRWCLDAAAALEPPAAVAHGTGGWRVAFDRIADDLRGALGWAAGEVAFRAEAHQLAVMLGDLCFARGMPSESQRRYEQAASLADDARSASAALHHAAGAAETSAFGNESLRLHRAAADAALRAGDRAAAAIYLAQAAELAGRAPGHMNPLPPASEVEALLGDSAKLASGDPAARARTIAATAFNRDEGDAGTAELVEQALALARQACSPLIESAALDRLSAVQLARGDVRAAVESSMRRLELLAPLPITAASGAEFADAYVMTTDCAIAAGDLRAARQLAERLRDLPHQSEEVHLKIARLVVVTALTGNWNESLALAAQLRDGWDRAGQPSIGSLRPAARAAAAVHGLCGNDDDRDAWLAIADVIDAVPRPHCVSYFGEFFNAMLLLHRGQAETALRVLDTPPEQFTTWTTGLWRPWYAALWAEAAVIAAHHDAADRIRRARLITADNPIAAAIVDRAAALAGDREGLAPAAAALEAAGCRYQWARALVMCGGSAREQGEAALAEMGATAMAWPPG